MPEELPEATKNEIVRLRREDPEKWSYKALREKTGVRQDSTIAKVLTQAGLAKPRSKTSATASATASPPRGTDMSTAESATSSGPSSASPSPGDGVSDLQPPAAKPKAQAVAKPDFWCSACSMPGKLDPGEEKATACPSCGEAFE